jgi:antirestriction protein ArdC
MSQMVSGYPSADWISFRQALSLGGHVRKGEHGTAIFFYTVVEKDKEDTDRARRFPVLKSYTVFNVAQCEGLEIVDDRPAKEPFERLADSDAFIAAIGATIRYGGDRAYYSPSSDEIVLPNPESFSAPEHFYATALHELAHHSGAKHRLAREFGKRFGDDAYAFEELVAELTSAYLCAELNIPGTLRHPEYLASWVKTLRADAKALLTAGARASEAADYLARLAGRRGSEAVDENLSEAA